MSAQLLTHSTREQSVRDALIIVVRLEEELHEDMSREARDGFYQLMHVAEYLIREMANHI